MFLLKEKALRDEDGTWEPQSPRHTQWRCYTFWKSWGEFNTQTATSKGRSQWHLVLSQMYNYPLLSSISQLFSNILRFFKKYGPFSKSSSICYNITFVLCSGFWLWGMWDLKSATRDCSPSTGWQSLQHWIASKSLYLSFWGASSTGPRLWDQDKLLPLNRYSLILLRGYPYTQKSDEARKG